MSWPYDAFCPKHGYVSTKPFPIGEEGLVYGCGVCDNLMIYRDEAGFIEDQRERYEEVKSCEHQFRRNPEGVVICDWCGILPDMSPEDAIHERAKAEVLTEA